MQESEPLIITDLLMDYDNGLRSAKSYGSAERL